MPAKLVGHDSLDSLFRASAAGHAAWKYLFSSS
jgi:hypothetical protein